MKRSSLFYVLALVTPMIAGCASNTDTPPEIEAAYAKELEDFNKTAPNERSMTAYSVPPIGRLPDDDLAPNRGWVTNVTAVSQTLRVTLDPQHDHCHIIVYTYNKDGEWDMVDNLGNYWDDVEGRSGTLRFFFLSMPIETVKALKIMAINGSGGRRELLVDRHTSRANFYAEGSENRVTHYGVSQVDTPFVPEHEVMDRSRIGQWFPRESQLSW